MQSRVMTSAEKLKAARERFKALGINPNMGAPPVLRVFWLVGIPVPPLVFLRFGTIALITGVFFAVFWGFLMVLLLVGSGHAHVGCVWRTGLGWGGIRPLQRVAYACSRSKARSAVVGRVHRKTFWDTRRDYSAQRQLCGSAKRRTPDQIRKNRAMPILWWPNSFGAVVISSSALCWSSHHLPSLSQALHFAVVVAFRCVARRVFYLHDHNHAVHHIHGYHAFR